MGPPGSVCLTIISTIMAIINSLAIGKAVKSAGNLTYKTVRGRTIAAQKITTNKSNTVRQASQRSSFAVMSKCMKLLQAYIDVAYEKSKYGSSRNHFARVNNRFNLGGVYPEITEGAISLAEGFMTSLMVAPDKSVALNFVCDGSLSCIVNEQLQTYPSVYFDATISKTAFENVRAAVAGSSIDYIFPSGVKYSDIELIGVGIFANNIQVITAYVDENGVIDPISGDFGTFVSHSFSVIIDETSGLVTQISVATDTPWSGGDGFAGSILFPRVGGKVPQSRAFILAEHTAAPGA